MSLNTSPPPEEFLINREHLINSLKEKAYYQDTVLVIQTIYEEPIAKGVVVTRCMRCKHFSPYSSPQTCSHPTLTTPIPTTESDYCSRAEPISLAQTLIRKLPPPQGENK